MEILAWWIFAIGMSLFSASNNLVNQFLKAPGTAVIFWIRSFLILIFLPVIWHMQWPDSPIFYAAIVANSLIVSYTDVRMYDFTAKFGGAMLSRLAPLGILSSFFLWFLFKPSLLMEYIHHPLESIGILVCIMGVAVSSWFLRKCEVSMAAIKYLWPTILLGGFITVFNKMAMDNSPLESGIYGYIFLQSVLVVIINSTYQSFNTKAGRWSGVFTRKGVYSGFILALCGVGYGLNKGYAFSLVEHPAYVDAIAKMSVIWIMLIYWAIGHKEESKVIPGLGIVVFCVGIILLKL